MTDTNGSTLAAGIIAKLCSLTDSSWTAESGAIIHNCGFVGGERYYFDGRLKYSEGWRQYDTNQDASYFGIWVHIEERAVVTFAEGDLSIATAETPEKMRAELERMAAFYGPPPPAYKVIDDDGTLTHIYTARPEVA